MAKSLESLRFAFALIKKASSEKCKRNVREFQFILEADSFDST